MSIEKTIDELREQLDETGSSIAGAFDALSLELTRLIDSINESPALPKTKVAKKKAAKKKTAEETVAEPKSFDDDPYFREQVESLIPPGKGAIAGGIRVAIGKLLKGFGYAKLDAIPLDERDSVYESIAAKCTELLGVDATKTQPKSSAKKLKAGASATVPAGAGFDMFALAPFTLEEMRDELQKIAQPLGALSSQLGDVMNNMGYQSADDVPEGERKKLVELVRKKAAQILQEQAGVNTNDSWDD